MKRKRAVGYVGPLIAVFLFFTVRAVLCLRSPAGASALGDVGPAEEGVWGAFFAGTARPASGRVEVPLDWLLMCAVTQAACGMVMGLVGGYWGIQASLRAGSSTNAWRLLSTVLCAVAAGWVAIAFLACALAGMSLGEAPVGPSITVLLLEFLGMAALLFVQALVSLIAGPAVGFCLAFAYSALAFIGPWVALPPSWMMLARSPWLWQGPGSASWAVAATAAILVLEYLLGAVVARRRDWLVRKR